MTSQTINLNLIPGSIEPVINVSQYDKGQTWNFNIYSGSQPFTIPTGSSITIQGTKPDKTGFQYGCTFNGNVVTAIEQQQMTILSGKVPAEIVITKDDELIGSLNFNIMVEKAALADDTAISETDLPLIEEAVEALSHIDETLETMEGYKEDSEAYAIGKRNGSDVGSSDPAYHNNSKYYAGQASSSASSASGSATSAGTNALISEGYAVGKQNGSAVGSGSPYYQNNAEYYKGQAANSATNAGNSATAASGSATTASNKALVAEGYADGKQNGTDVASGSPYYHNNSKYYSEQAAASAQSAAQSAASFTVDSALSTSSTNPVQNKVITTDLNNVKQALSNQVDKHYLLGKNIWSYGSNLFTVYTEIDVDIPSGSYTFMADVISNDTNSSNCLVLFYYDNNTPVEKLITRGSGVSFTVTFANHVKTLRFYASNNFNNSQGDTALFTNIMLSTEGGAYVPYVPSNLELLSYKDNGVLGAKNLFGGKFTTAVDNGITFTANVDGTVTTSDSVGSARAYSQLSSSEFTLKAGTYILSRNEVLGSGDVKRTSVTLISHNGTTIKQLTTLTEDSFTLDTDTSVYIRLTCAKTGESYYVTFKPMIRLATDSDPTYQPYAMTNKELTDEYIGESIRNISSILGTNISATSYGSFIERKNGVVYMNLNLTNSVALSSGDIILTLPTGFRPKGIIRAISYNNVRFVIDPNGNVYSSGDSAPANGVILINIAYPV